MLLPVDLRDPNAGETAERLYREMIDDAAESCKAEIISNKDPRHAAYLMQTLFKRAKKHVRIYTTQLARNVGREQVYASPDLIGAATALATERPDTRVSVIVQEALDIDEGMAPTDHPLIKGLSSERARLRVCQYEGERQFGDFAVMDESAYRVETDDRKATAMANFGDPEFASILAKLFDLMMASDQCRVIVALDTLESEGDTT